MENVARVVEHLAHFGTATVQLGPGGLYVVHYQVQACTEPG